jgi:hypothetical protein
MPVSAKVADRITSQLKRYQPILSQARQRDISESDTCIIVADMLSDIFGYTKYEHITTEHCIRGTYVDLAIQIDDELRFLIEVKPIGVDLKDNHVRQSIDYGANKGVEWVVLTNGVVWRVYKIIFAQPIEKTLVCEVDALALSNRSPEILECFGNLSRECFSKASMGDLFQEKQVTNKYALASVLLSDPIVEELRRELRRLSPGLRIYTDALKLTLSDYVIKRELIDSEEAKAAQTAMRKLARAYARERSRRSAGDETEEVASGPAAVASAAAAPEAS